MVAVSLKATLKRFSVRSVASRVEYAQDRILKRQAYQLMRDARESIEFARSKRRNAPPGRPPYKHKRRGKATVAYITYAYDRRLAKAIIGPEKLPGARNTVLPALEKGGIAAAFVGSGRWAKRRVQARPFMLPALQRASRGMARMWRGSVK